ncbi:CBS domain-containing protein (plasmid) [Haloarcula sp. JP-L23]|nr:CBS domain-containing protein [Haloarcula sp. JP-L23]
MTRSVRTITAETTACTVAKLFAEYDIGSAVVVSSETDDLIGIVTRADIMQQVASGAEIVSVPVSAFMSKPVITINSTANIHTAATLMKEHSIRRLPVVDDGHLVGILTTTNLTHYLPRLRNTILRERNELAGQ